MNQIEEDKKLVSRIINKDERALWQFFQKYKKSLSNFIGRQISDIAQVEEITQDTFFDFIEGIRDFNFQSSLKTYLFSIAKNKIIDVIRKKKLKKILFSALPSYVVEGLKVIFIDEEIERNELNKKIKNTLKNLPNDYEFVLRLKYIEGEKVASIAKKMSLGFKATESLIFRARKAFVKIFNNN